ncbi:tetratricopeptide repeat protein [Micromonospora sp. NPDC050397]|uniref:tetratricopeptide repeat protein n=1 Tax=Micromonospora sp. NPDC050397 TaxID=3364279 RepID=UPI00384D06FF
MAMTSGGSRREVVRLTADGERCHARGDLPGAIDRYQRACTLVREATEAEPWDADNPQQLGSMLYTLGEWLRQADDYQGAVDALVEAETAYERLGGSAGQLVADVLIRRARVHAGAGRPLSAIADAQQAVTTCLDLRVERSDAEGAVPAARVVALAAQVQMAIGGDPDVAASAADWALREFLAAYRRGNQFALPAAHALPVHAAAAVAFIVHGAAGRDELARMAQWFLATTSPDEPLPGNDVAEQVINGQPSLARALATAGKHDLVETLTAPATEVRILAPSMRCSPQLAPAYATTLGELLVSAPDADELLFGLEAHALFAAASQQRVVGMRYQFGEFGRHWAAAVINFGQRQLESDRVPAALDAAGWLAGIIGQLAPYAMIDPKVRFDALSCSRWQHDLYRRVGDTGAAAQVAEVIAMLEAMPGS